MPSDILNMHWAGTMGFKLFPFASLRENESLTSTSIVLQEVLQSKTARSLSWQDMMMQEVSRTTEARSLKTAQSLHNHVISRIPEELNKVS